jgi:transposase
MIAAPPGVHIWLVAGVTDMRKGFDGLSTLVQIQLREDPFAGQLFVFRSRRGDRIKVLWWDGDGLCLYAKRLERGHFVWPRAKDGCVALRCVNAVFLLVFVEYYGRPSSITRGCLTCRMTSRICNGC